MLAGWREGNMLSVHDLTIVVAANTPKTHSCNVLPNTESMVDGSDGSAVAKTDSD